ncbi:hypothetical protein K1719_036594 [Acacia pycnantha]|nr:hypothetical protein K1719_036594 [Acacia pycnantha]
MALTWSLGGEVVIHSILKLDIPGWLHYATIRVIVVLPALYCVQSAGAEGITSQEGNLRTYYNYRDTSNGLEYLVLYFDAYCLKFGIRKLLEILTGTFYGSFGMSSQNS